MEKIVTTATKEPISNDSGSVVFNCPARGIDKKCVDSVIVRNTHERKLGIKYTCPQCGFTGPN